MTHRIPKFLRNKSKSDSEKKFVTEVIECVLDNEEINPKKLIRLYQENEFVF